MATTAPSQAPSQVQAAQAIEPQAEPTKPTKAGKKILVQTVYGPMVNLYTSQRIDGVTEVPEIDGWLQAQIDAGKLIKC